MNGNGRNSTQKKRLKARLFANSKRCCFCRRSLTIGTATVEHFVPLAQGGNWAIANLRLSCSACNCERGTMDFVTFRREKGAVRERHNA